MAHMSLVLTLKRKAKSPVLNQKSPVLSSHWERGSLQGSFDWEQGSLQSENKARMSHVILIHTLSWLTGPYYRHSKEPCSHRKEACHESKQSRTMERSNPAQQCLWPDPSICVTWLIRMCDVTHPYVWHDLFLRVLWLIRLGKLELVVGLQLVTWILHICAMTHPYVCHDSSICVPWLIHMCAMTYSYVCHDSFICVPW